MRLRGYLVPLLLVCAAYAQNSYTTAGADATDATGNQASRIWQAANSQHGKTNITVTFSGATTGGTCIAAEFSNIAAANPIDVTGVKNTGQSVANVFNGAAGDASVTTTNASDLVVGGISGNVDAISATGGFTSLQILAGNAAAYKIVGSTGSYQPVWTGTAASFAASVVAYKSNGSTPSLVQASDPIDMGTGNSSCVIPVNPTGTGNLITVFTMVAPSSITVSSITDAPPNPRLFYVDFVGGHDGATGLNKTTDAATGAWQHAPCMPNSISGYIHQVGDEFIFKGGVTWTNASLPCSISVGGNANNIDYYGVDQTWFAGGAFTKPKFDCGQAVNCDGLDVLSGTKFIKIDGISIAGMWISQASGSCGRSIYIQQPNNNNIDMLNLDVHNWRTDGTTTLDGVPGQCGGIYNNQDNFMSTGINLTSSHVHNEDGGHMNSTNTAILQASAGGTPLRGIQNLAGNEIDHASTVFLHGGKLGHDNLAHDIVPSFDPSFHTNNFFIDLWSTTDGVCIDSPAIWYRNKILNSQANASPLYPNPGSQGGGASCPAVTMYLYNNVVAGGNPPYALSVDPFNANTGQVMNVVTFNNTMQVPVGDITGCSRDVNRGGSQVLTSFTQQNDHCIQDGGQDFTCAAGSCTTSNNVSTNNQTAANQGYNAASQFAPPGATAQTVTTVGATITCSVCPDLLKAFGTVTGFPFSQASRLNTTDNVGAYKFAVSGAGGISLKGISAR